MIGHIPFGFGVCAFFFVYSRQSFSINISDFERRYLFKKRSNKNTELGTYTKFIIIVGILITMNVNMTIIVNQHKIIFYMIG